MKTIQQLAQDALDIQDASNLSGVVHAFDRFITDLWAIARAEGKDTDWINSHPIVAMYLDKLSDLNHRKSETDFFQVYEICTALSKGLHI